jgi:hypothetical protein
MSSKARQLADLGNQVDDGSITGTNMVVNGGLTVWQRGTSHAAGSGINYTADRFWRYNPSATGTIERSTDAPDGFEYSLFFNVTGGGNNLGTGVELTRQGFFPQQMYTLSMYLKGDFSGTSIYINFRNSAGSGTDNVDITTFNSFGNYSDWTRVTIPVDTTGISPNANNLFMNMEFGGFPDGGKITGVCLNVGDSAIDFPHESYGETLAKCQRYLQKIGNGTSDYKRFAVCYNWAGYGVTTNALMPLPVQLRSLPSLSTVGTFAAYHGNASLNTVSGITFETAGSSLDVASLQVATTGLVRGDIAFLIGNNDASAAILLDAEL